LPQCAGRCLIGQPRSDNRTIGGFRFVPPFAAVCRSLVQQKGNWSFSALVQAQRKEAEFVKDFVVRFA
jgi:hypothetical protein